MTEMLNQDSRPGNDLSLTCEATREAWLHRAIEAFRPRFAEIACRCPASSMPRSASATAGGQRASTYSASAGPGGPAPTGLTTSSSARRKATRPGMLVSLLHELIHAADDCTSGHRGAFAEAATRLGFEGPMTQTPPGIELTAEVITLAEALGPLPHAKLDPATADVPAARRGPRARPGRQDSQRPRQAGDPHDQADRRRVLWLHRPYHPQMGRPGLPAVPARSAHARGMIQPGRHPKSFKRPWSSRIGDV